MKSFLLRFKRRLENKRITISSTSRKPHFESDEKQRKGSMGRSILSRLLSSIKRSKQRNGSERKRKGRSVTRYLLIGCYWKSRVKGKSVEAVAAADAVGPGKYTKKVPLNFGVGLGLVYLFAACKNEVNKIPKLREEMEVLIEDVKSITSEKEGVRSKSSGKEGVRSKPSEKEGVRSKPLELNEALSISPTDSPVVETSSNHTPIQNCAMSPLLVETGIVSDTEWCFELDISNRDACEVGVDQMEAELELELERLQLKLDAEDSFEYQQQDIEIMAPDNIHINTNLEVDDFQEPDNLDYLGVCPRKLERRLYELLEARQQERITELESALDCVKKKLEQQEAEVSRWKGIAEVFSQHVPEARCMSR